MASSEDDLAKKEVQEAIWDWAGKFVALAAVFILGFFASWWLWGYGPNGAPELRAAKEVMASQLTDLQKKRIDAEGRATVLDGQLGQCRADLAKARAGGSGSGT